jgi:prepilin-type N-terminal cleavage/methylation domain-containing protein
MQANCRIQTGFTLIELLVVIAVIGRLAALLLPALSRARARSLGIACTSNSRQLGPAWRLYAHDNVGQLVRLHEELDSRPRQPRYSADVGSYDSVVATS